MFGSNWYAYPEHVAVLKKRRIITLSAYKQVNNGTTSTRFAPWQRCDS